MNTKTIGAIVAALVIIIGGAFTLGMTGGDKAETSSTGSQEASIQPAASDATAESDKGLDGIVVVDVQRLETVSKAAKSLESQLKERRDAFQKELASEEKSLRAEREAIVKDQSKMSKDELEKKAKAFEQKLTDSRKKLDEKRQAFDEQVGKALGKLREQVVKAVGDIATERGYRLVLTRQNVVIVEKQVDITEDALKLMDSRVTEIPLEDK